VVGRAVVPGDAVTFDARASPTREGEMEACNVEGGSGGVLVAPDALRAMSGKERFAYRLGLAVAEAVATGHAWAADYAPRLAADGPDALPVAVPRNT